MELISLRARRPSLLCCSATKVVWNLFLDAKAPSSPSFADTLVSAVLRGSSSEGKPAKLPNKSTDPTTTHISYWKLDQIQRPAGFSRQPDNAEWWMHFALVLGAGCSIRMNPLEGLFGYDNGNIQHVSVREVSADNMMQFHGWYLQDFFILHLSFSISFIDFGCSTVAAWALPAMIFEITNSS